MCSPKRTIIINSIRLTNNLRKKLYDIFPKTIYTYQHCTHVQHLQNSTSMYSILYRIHTYCNKKEPFFTNSSPYSMHYYTLYKNRSRLHDFIHIIIIIISHTLTRKKMVSKNPYRISTKHDKNMAIHTHLLENTY